MSLAGNAVLAALVGQFEATERSSRAVIDDMQGQQLEQLWTHHRRHTPSFFERLNAAGLGSGRGDPLQTLRALPPIGRRDIQAAGRGFFSTQVPETHQPISEVSTSGSTGEPVRILKTRIQSLFWAANTLRDLHWHGIDLSGRISTIRPHVETYYERDGWGRPVDDLYVSGRAQGIPVRTDIAEQLAMLRLFSPDVLVIHPSNLAAFIDHWRAEGFSLPNLKHVRTIGETVSEDLRQRLSSLTGLMIEDHYSAQETGSIALQCPHSGLYHIVSELALVEVLDDDGRPCGPGQIGHVVVTDLHNLATPVIRYRIGDLAEVGHDCPCGRGMPTLRRILGRERNLVLLPDGSRHWPMVVQIGHAFEAVVPVRQFQLVQTGREVIEMRVVTDEPVSEARRQALITAVQDGLGYAFDVRVVGYEGRLPLAANGKFEDFLCLVEADPPPA